ncbi:MAG: CocE/NonD family hydrolase, partial [Chromatiales bacterium]|nr:CocE/NonD family hydrolase [Chromatiales bacterium]
MRRNSRTVTFLPGLLTATLLLFTPGQDLLAAQPASAPEYQVEMKEAWITMPDGVRLAADLYMPAGDVEGKKFPVILEYLPYRKTEARARNYSMYSYFVERGYVLARVDIRGTGNSEGKLIPYEYSDIEQVDGETVIDWLSKQTW